MTKLLVWNAQQLRAPCASQPATPGTVQQIPHCNKFSRPPTRTDGSVVLAVADWWNSTSDAITSRKCRVIFNPTIDDPQSRCPCGSQFCYVCGQRWKSCQCAQWNEDRLLSRAQQVVARQPGRGAPIQARVAAAVQNLRDRHNCNHGNWRYIRGAHRCEECYYAAPSFIFQCPQ